MDSDSSALYLMGALFVPALTSTQNFVRTFRELTRVPGGHVVAITGVESVRVSDRVCKSD
ncbi:MAG: hypothetical protein ACREX4_25105 [Gammaproteobacteria bacterium]